MIETKINIYNETQYKFIPRKKIKEISLNCLNNEKRKLENLNIIFLTDQDIQKLNLNYLNHDFTTDVISFDLSDENEKVGEIYISLDTAKAQANEYKVSFSNEILRLVAHGTLHICGYEDDNPDLKQKMHLKENELLNSLK